MLTKKRKLSLILIGLTTVFWGLGFPLTKICVDSGASPALINAIRFVGATILFGGIFFKKIHLNWRKFKYGAIGGALLFVAFLLQTTGQIYTSPTNSGFFASVSVVLIPFISWIVFKRKPNNFVFISVALCVLGAVFLNFGGSADSASAPNAILGNALTIGSALLFAIQVVYSSFVLTKMNNYDLTIVQFIVCGILFCVYFLCVDVPQGVLASIDWNKFILPVIFMAVFGTAFAYGSQTFAQMHISPSEVALILSFESVLGAFFSILMGLDQLHWSIIVGGALMFASILIVEVLPEIIEKRKRSKLVAEEAKEVAEYNKEIIEQTKEIDDKELKKR